MLVKLYWVVSASSSGADGSTLEQFFTTVFPLYLYSQMLLKVKKEQKCGNLANLLHGLTVIIVVRGLNVFYRVLLGMCLEHSLYWVYNGIVIAVLNAKRRQGNRVFWGNRDYMRITPKDFPDQLCSL